MLCFALPCSVLNSEDDILRVTFMLDEATAAKLGATLERFAHDRAA